MKRRTRVLAGLSVLAIVAVASCGDDDNATTNTTTPGSVKTATTTASSGAATTSGSSTATTGGGSTATTGGGSTSTTAGSETTTGGTTPEAGPGEHHVTKDEGKPVKGGTLRYGTDSDSANPWAPYRVSCATSCYVPLSIVSDALLDINDKGEAVPLLAESLDHNADYTQWTMKIRDGIKFQDGTPLDGAAVKFNIDTCRASALTGAAYSPIGSVTADGQVVTLTMQGGPWVALPPLFTFQAQCGYMFSPKWLGSLPDVPQRNDKSPVYDATLAATPAGGDPAKPVGLGPFTFQSYTPGNGNSFKAVRNEDYWRGPKGITGEDLPYLDAIEATVFVDVDSRSNALRSGQIDAMHTANADAVSQFLDDNSFELTSGDRFGETNYILLDTASGDTDPQGKNAKSPLLNLDCRKALAYAIDNDRIAKERGAGLVRVSDGPFPPGSVGYLKDTGYPTYDPTKAKSEMDVCLSALKTDHIDFTFNTTNDPFNVESNTLITSMWSDVFGNKVKASITPIEQGAYIGLALTGAFQAQGWRNHGGWDPDQQRLWWQSSSSAPIGGLALNFGRFKDPDMDKQLNILKTNPDPAARKAAAEEVNRIFGAKVYNWWNTWALWGIITQPYVNGVEAHTLPDGSKGIGLAFAGRHQVNQMWCDNGKCG
jgi:peptide/nickel transport system substrate-binding protein